MPETKYSYDYKYVNGKRIKTAIPYEVSDEELAEEAKAEEVKLIIEQLPDKGINKAWKRLLEKGILP